MNYEGTRYPAEVTDVESEGLVTLKCMKKDQEKGSIWVWPKQEDKVVHYLMSDGAPAENPKMYGSMKARTLKYFVEELTDEWGTVDLRKLCANVM